MSLVSRVDHDGAALPPDILALYETERQRAGRVTNMKAILLHSPAAFQVFGQWLSVKAEVREVIGDRALSIYSHAISAVAGCLLCSTYFRRLLLAEGLAPENFTPTPDEALLIELGHAVGDPQQAPNPDLMPRVVARYGQKATVDLMTYGGTMLATNVFNNLLGIDLDDYLEPFRLSPARAGAGA